MKRAAWLLPVLAAACLLSALLHELGGAPSAVDWRALRAVVLESDDWGLSGFFPSAAEAAAVDRAALAAGNFPAPYWGSTLEDSADVARLAGLLAEHRGADGLPPVLQANYIVSALHYRAAPDSAAWRRYDLPSLPPRYERPGLWSAVDSARARGVWRAEFHGSFHYDDHLRRRAVAADPRAAAAARLGVLLFPGSSRAWEWGHWRARETLAQELDLALGVFRQRFGHAPVSICAPDYVWDGRAETLWAQRGLNIIQAKREQRHPRWPGGSLGERLLKALARIRDRSLHPGRTYLDRNCRFEPAQHPGGPAAAIAQTVAEVKRAWAAGRPAVIETHRVNYVSLVPGQAEAGRSALAKLLEALQETAGPPPLYLVDHEVAELQRAGVSVSRRGSRLVMRNLTRTLRLACLPDGRFAPLSPGMTVVLPADNAVPRILLPAAASP